MVFFLNTCFIIIIIIITFWMMDIWWSWNNWRLIDNSEKIIKHSYHILNTYCLKGNIGFQNKSLAFFNQSSALVWINQFKLLNWAHFKLCTPKWHCVSNLKCECLKVIMLDLIDPVYPQVMQPILHKDAQLSKCWNFTFYFNATQKHKFWPVY